MADTIQRVEYFKVMVPNSAGTAAKYLAVLKEYRVNLLAFTGFPRAGRAQLDFVPQDAAAFRKALRKAGLSAGKGRTAFLIQGSDRPGVLEAIAAKVAAAGVNMTALDAVAAAGRRYGALLWVKPRDVAKTAKALGAR
ncbi:MAG: hypothetical protein ACM3L8_01315 [Verrucomicrobiota bacterium]